MAAIELMPDGMEDLIRDLSSFLILKLNELGCQKYGIEKDDLLQEIHIKIWKACHNGREIQYFNAYVKKIINSVFIDEINRIRREDEKLRSSSVFVESQNGANGNGAPGGQLATDMLLASVDRLREARQRVIKLRLEGFTLEEIAGMNGWSYDKTYAIFSRGLRDLKRQLGRKGVQYED